MRKFTSSQTFYSTSSSSSSSVSSYQTTSSIGTQISRTTITSDGGRRTITQESCKCIPIKASTVRLEPVTHSTVTRTKSAQCSEQPITITAFQQECLVAHNKFRKRHGCPPLELDKNLSNYATEWARNIASKNVMQHRSNNRYGENIFWASGKNVDGQEVVQSWYDEIKNYRFGRGGFSSNTGHFTQVVWKSSRKLGVGIERRGSSTWVVANYDPPGNCSGQYQDNVPSP